MKRLGFFLLASGLFWTGCIGNDSLGTATTAQRNIENLARISIGMTSDQVFQIMRQPYRSEVFELDDNRYEVWFYVTSITLMEQKKLTHTNLTPLTFKNGVLQGKGYTHYQALLTQEEAKTKAEDESDSRRDKNIEKALQPPPGPAKPVKPIPAPPEPAPKTPAKQKPKSSTYPPQAKQPPDAKQPPAPVQPTQPPPSVQPTTPPKTAPTQNKVSMSKKPSSDQPPEKTPDQPDNTTKKPVKDKKASDSKSNVPLTEKDQQMIDQEQEENFDFW